MNRRKKMLMLMGGDKKIEQMTLEEAMLYLFNVAYWPMTETSGNAIDHKNDFDIVWDADLVRANYALPNDLGSIPTFNGLAEGSIASGVFAAFATAFPYNKGSFVCLQRVPDVATWETADGAVRYLFDFTSAGAESFYVSKPNMGTVRGYRNSNSYFDVGGLISPALIGLTWDTATGLLKFFTNGEQSVVSVGSQVDKVSAISSTYTRIGADTSFGTNKWVGQIGYFGLSNSVLTAAQFKSIFKKYYPTTRKFFIIGDSKSTGGNFWPGYLTNLLNAETGDYWTDGPRRYALGGYDINSMKVFIDANLSTETETPELIIINMGTNDARPVTITTEVLFKASYNSIIASCQAKWPGVPIFCQRIYRADSAQTISNSTTINGYIDDIVASYGSGVYDGPDDETWAENGDSGATYLSAIDHIHYALAAHSVLAGLWEAILTPYI